MENKNQPAFPDTMRAAPQSYLNQYPEQWPTGMTKRELVAAMALQGILAKSHATDGMTEHEVKSITADSILFADELLTQLEGQKP
jgi:hypothetical protein